MPRQKHHGRRYIMHPAHRFYHFVGVSKLVCPLFPACLVEPQPITVYRRDVQVPITSGAVLLSDF
jgi:hypothetical protein